MKLLYCDFVFETINQFLLYKKLYECTFDSVGMTLYLCETQFYYTSTTFEPVNQR